MLRRAPLASLSLALAVCTLLPACNTVPQRYLQQSQLRTQQMYLQNRNLAMERQGIGQSLGAIASEKAQLEQQNLALRSQVDLANQRVNNLQSANDQLEQRMRNHLASHKNPLNNDQIKRFEDLRRRYPEFEFDPETGISKFSTDLLFASGSDDVTARSQEILQEFARIMNNADAQHLKVLVVGHTDDRPIGKVHTRTDHPTNWHLSTDRANAVVLALRKAGITETRMGSAGYSMYQPLEPNKTEAERSKNRRVEIFVLAPDASVAGWSDDESELK